MTQPALGDSPLDDYFAAESAGLCEIVNCGYEPGDNIPSRLGYQHIRLESHCSSFADPESNWPTEASGGQANARYLSSCRPCCHQRCCWQPERVCAIGTLGRLTPCERGGYRALLDRPLCGPAWRFFGDVAEDYRHFYSWHFIKAMSVGLGIHAILANTSLDEDIRESVQASARGNPNALAFGRELGDHAKIIPGIVAIWGLDVIQDRLFENHRLWHPVVGQWARQSVRAYAVGAPLVGLQQLFIGASRPGESTAGSRWKPWQDDNGVSGHAFVGAVPFIVAAKKCDGLLLKSAFYFGSTLTAYSRVYDDKHYMSQAVMGWWMAYLAVEATECTERTCRQYRVIPASVNGLPGLGLEYRY